MPADVYGRGYKFLPKDDTLTFAEIVRLSNIFIGLGVSKLRLTGGEPLLRPDLPELVRSLRETAGDLTEIALTTNGTLLAKMAGPLKAAGLNRVTVSLDALAPNLFSSIGGTSLPPHLVLDGIKHAIKEGLGMKINTVVQRGVNESEILPIARLARDLHIPIRFIEFMDVGNTNDWSTSSVVPSSEILARLQEHFELRRIPQADLTETARRFRHSDLPDNVPAEVGFISSITQPFCTDCTRARLTTDGRLFTCLFASKGHDLRALLRIGANDQIIRKTLEGIWSQRSDRYSETRGNEPSKEKAEMSYLGG